MGGGGSLGINTKRKKQLMIYFNTILSIIIVGAFTTAGIVWPFVLLHWGLGCGIFISIIGALAWFALVLCLNLLTAVNSDPEEEQ